MSSKYALIVFVFMVALGPRVNNSFGQEANENEVPPINLLRAEESYLFLKDAEAGQVFLQPLKFISLDDEAKIHLTLGGEYRPRVEHFTNRDYTSFDETYYSQRLSLHASLNLGSRIRLFGEVYHGLTSGEDRLFEDEAIDLHQGFLEFVLHQKTNSSIILRMGRQEIGYGVSRLIGIREGPNMRRSFDLIRLNFKKNKRSINLVYGKELSYGFNAFDNTSNFFESDTQNPTLWGIYVQDNVLGRIGNLDFYYFGFNSNSAQFNDKIGEETRHSFGIRSYGQIGRYSFNTEFIYQFGDIGNSTISAFNLETDWKYQLTEGGWKPKLGIQLDFSSGDRTIGDGKIQTFNPLFVNPALYSLAGVNTPANLSSFHPNFTIYPSDGLSIFIDYALFYRTSANDGLYTPPRFLLREANGLDEKHIGDVLGLQVQYEINRNISFDLRSSYFLAGKFIKASGNSENTFYIAPTMNFKF
ncbi:alginate export family protein [Ulvibacterium sp.]|uniref:alginate export family protein n=1 Tax=Ulvibacterium sp. TaxID=2665914 RepID=UPI003CC611D1